MHFFSTLLSPFLTFCFHCFFLQTNSGEIHAIPLRIEKCSRFHLVASFPLYCDNLKSTHPVATHPLFLYLGFVDARINLSNGVTCLKLVEKAGALWVSV